VGRRGGAARRTLLAVLASVTLPLGAEDFVLVNGQWFDGERFVGRRAYVSGGIFVERPETAGGGAEVDLGGGFVVAPYGDAHAHVFYDPGNHGEDIELFRRQGVYAVLVQDSIVPPEARLSELLGSPGTPSFRITWGILTSRASGFAPPGSPVFFVEDVGSLEGQWREVASRPVDFLKVILAFSERHQGGVAEAPVGVAPAVLGRLVELAHRDGLQVSAHIETAADFRLALDAGVDYIAHLPASWRVAPGDGPRSTGFSDSDPSRWLLTDDDARRAARLGTALVTTTFRDRSSADYPLHAEIMRRNIGRLLEAGARVVLGTDFGGEIIDEVEHVAALTGADRAHLVRILTMDTPRAILPDRRVGGLEPGNEASFLVLGGDPLRDLGHLRDIRARMIAGRIYGIDVGEGPDHGAGAPLACQSPGTGHRRGSGAPRPAVPQAPIASRSASTCGRPARRMRRWAAATGYSRRYQRTTWRPSS